MQSKDIVMYSDTPKVSIILPVYNGEVTLAATLDSLLVQDFRNFELLICIDGTQDGSERIIKTCEDPRIRLYKNAKNLGLAGTLNRLVALTSPDSKYIAMAEQDDYYYPHRLALQVDYLEKHDDIGLVSGIAEHDSGNSIRRFPGMLDQQCEYPRGDAMFLLNFKEQIKVVNTAMMFRKNVHVENGLYFSRHYPSISVDWSYILRFTQHADIGAIHEVLVRMDRRADRNSLTTQKAKQFAAARELLRSFRYERADLITDEVFRYALTTEHILELKSTKISSFIFKFLWFYAHNPLDRRWKELLRGKVLKKLKKG